MRDVDRGARRENCGNARVCEASGVRRAVLGLEAETEIFSTHIYRVTKHAIYLGAVESRARSSGISDAESVLGEGVQDPAGIVEEFEGLISGVGDSRGNLQVLQSIDDETGGRSLHGQAGGS